MDSYERPDSAPAVQILITASQPGGLSLDQIAAVIREATPYPLQSITEDHDGVVAVLCTQTPDGLDALSSMYWSRLQLAQAHDADAMIFDLARGAAEGLARYVESFRPPPIWDQIQWGP